MPEGVAAMRALLLALGLLLAGGAQAQEQQSYEARHVFKALSKLGLEVERAPMGKQIGEIHIVRYEVFLDDEPFFTFPNALHWLTRERIIQQELLFAPGDDFDPKKMLETARNLRSLTILQLVAVVPVVSKDQGSVDVLVVTRDLWSLRLEWNLQFTGSNVDQLLVQLTERNLLGSNVRATIRTVLLPVTLTLGEIFVDRRFLGEPITLEQSADLFLNRETNAFEGYDAYLSVSRPLFNLGQRWGFRVPLRVQQRVARQVQNGEVLGYDDPDTPVVEEIPREWDSTFASASALARLQLSGAIQTRLSAGLGFSHRAVEVHDAAVIPAASRANFERDVLPRALTQVFPVAGVTAFQNEFRTFQNLSSYGVSEDVQIGFTTGLTLTAPLEALGSTVDAVELYGSAGFTQDFADDGLVDLAVGAEGRFEAGQWLNQQLLTRLRLASPRFGLGRFVARADWLRQVRDTTNSLVVLGGNNGLRGYASQAFFVVGGDRVRGNLEMRSSPVVWHYFHGGAVLFYDIGDVYGGLTNNPFRIKQAVGIGVRGLLPQFNREVFRLDLGVPVDGTGFMLILSGGTGQSVPLTAREDLQYDATVGGLAFQP